MKKMPDAEWLLMFNDEAGTELLQQKGETQAKKLKGVKCELKVKSINWLAKNSKKLR